MHTRTPYAYKSAGSAAAIFASPVGPRIMLDADRGGGMGAVLERFEQHSTENKTLHQRSADALKGATTSIQELDARLGEVEKKAARRPGEPERPSTWGASLVKSDQFKALVNNGSHQRGAARIEMKNITTSTAGVAMAPPDYRPDAVMLPMRPLTIRQLLAPGETSSNRVYYPRMTVRTQNAASVAEGALKPQSDMTFEAADADVQTIAHWFLVTRQILDDAPALASMIDTELRYGVDFEEDRQLLLGDGTGGTLLGLMSQATAFAAPFGVAGQTRIDILLQAVAQCEAAYLFASGIVLNPTDWRQIQSLKDAGGNYLIPWGPYGNGTGARTLWDVPMAPSFAMPLGHFLVGPFKDGAQIFDRMETVVEVSTEDSDNFRRNLITVRGEKRLALAVKRPGGFITGTMPVSPGTGN